MGCGTSRSPGPGLTWEQSGGRGGWRAPPGTDGAGGAGAAPNRSILQRSPPRSLFLRKNNAGAPAGAGAGGSADAASDICSRGSQPRPPGRHLCEEQVTEPGTRTAEESEGDLVICSLPAGTLPAPARPTQPRQQQKPERHRGAPGPCAQGCSVGAPPTPPGCSPLIPAHPGPAEHRLAPAGLCFQSRKPNSSAFSYVFFFGTFLNSLRSSPVPALPPAQSTQPPPELLIYKYLSGDILLVISTRRVEMAAIQAPDEDRRYDD